MKRAVLALGLAIGCGGAQSAVERSPDPEPTPVPTTAILPALQALTLRSSPAAELRAAMVIELGADGSIETECSATRLSPEGELFRGDDRVARLVRAEGDVLAVHDGHDEDTGLRIEADALIGPGDTRFAIAEGTITPSDPQVSPIGYGPPDAPPRLVLGVLALALVCADDTL